MKREINFAETKNLAGFASGCLDMECPKALLTGRPVSGLCFSPGQTPLLLASFRPRSGSLTANDKVTGMDGSLEILIKKRKDARCYVLLMRSPQFPKETCCCHAKMIEAIIIKN